jgi:hypothetical protein
VAELSSWTAASCICELTLSSTLSLHSRKSRKAVIQRKGKFNAKASLKPWRLLVGAHEYDCPEALVQGRQIHLVFVLSVNEQKLPGHVYLVGKYLPVPMMVRDFDPRVIATYRSLASRASAWRMTATAINCPLNSVAQKAAQTKQNADVDACLDEFNPHLQRAPNRSLRDLKAT